MKKILKTFTIVVVAFYICYLPYTISYTVFFYFAYTKKKVPTGNVVASNYIVTISQFLWFSNSCFNPVIYSKIHVKMYARFQRFLIVCREKWFFTINTSDQSNQDCDEVLSYSNEHTQESVVQNTVL